MQQCHLLAVKAYFSDSQGYISVLSLLKGRESKQSIIALFKTFYSGIRKGFYLVPMVTCHTLIRLSV